MFEQFGSDTRMNEFEIWKNDKLVDAVFYDSRMTTDEVRCDLIEHDGYSSSIIVVKKGE